jgi:hypothetical protein
VEVHHHHRGDERLASARREANKAVVLEAGLRDLELVLAAFDVARIQEREQSRRIRRNVSVCRQALGLCRGKIQRKNLAGIVHVEQRLGVDSGRLPRRLNAKPP